MTRSEIIKYDTLKEMIEDCPAVNHVWVAWDLSEKKAVKQYTGIHLNSPNYDVFVSDFLEHNLHLYEILPAEVPIFPYFDCEIDDLDETEHEMKINLFINCLKQLFLKHWNTQLEQDDFIILNSSRPNKLSYHIIIKNNCYFSSVESMKCFILWLFEYFENNIGMKETLGWLYKGQEQRFIFDKLPYGSNQCFRLINQSKQGKNFVLKCDKKPEDCFVRCFDTKGLVCLNVDKFNVEKKISIKKTMIKYEIRNDDETEKNNEENQQLKQELEEYIKTGVLKNVACGNYNDWRDIGFSIYNTFGREGVKLFIEFSMLDENRFNKTETIELYNSFKPYYGNKLTFETIRWWANKNKNTKIDVNEVFKDLNFEDLNHEDNKNEIDEILYISLLELNSGYNTSVIISTTLKKELVFCNESWYMLDKDTQLWVKIKEPAKIILQRTRKYIDYSNKTVVLKIQETEGEEKEKLIKKSKDYLASYKTIESSGYLSVLVKCLKTDLLDNHFEDKLNMNIGKLAFKNGIVNLKTKEFRKGVEWSDFLTETIPYDYIPSNGIFVKSKLKEILNNNDQHLEYFLTIIGYSFIGIPDLEKSMYFMIDKTDGGNGDNGKTFYFDILNCLLPNYVYRTKSSLIEDNNTKLHKQIALTKGKRIVWLEELPKGKKLNEALMKEIGDGKQLENEVMFKTSETIKILFKMFALSNHIPKIDPNEDAVYNRYKQISFNSHFDRTGTRVKNDPVNLKFIADKGLSENIKQNYKDEVFNLIIEYASKYYEKGMPPIPAQFIEDTKETKNKNDNFGMWFDEYLEVCEEGIIAKKFIINKSGMNDILVSEGMQRKGFKYDKDLRKGLGKDSCGTAYKGGYAGVKYIEKKEEEEEEEEGEGK